MAVLSAQACGLSGRAGRQVGDRGAPQPLFPAHVRGGWRRL